MDEMRQGWLMWKREGWGWGGWRYLKRKWGFRKEDITQIHISFHLAHACAHALYICIGHFLYSWAIRGTFLQCDWVTRQLSLLQTVSCRCRSASNSSNLLCCSQMQSSCISWVRSSRRGFSACVPACTLLLMPYNSERAYADTRRGRQIVSLSAYDPQGQQPTAAPVAPFQTLNDLSKQRLQKLRWRTLFYL